ncbi:PREDICTED: signal-regulatory protein beta-1 isoform 3-like, partial [Calidris pugnax]|uniref:signal-regulatory protein beta-1 isoform 3-like n=1 Tax=Calidris pugnax TaxID=198806 RepID=UPI00071E4C7A
FELQQPQDKVSVKARSTLTLSCTVSGDGPAGPVKWLKGWGRGSEVAYDQTGSFPRVTRAEDGSNTDFTIHIRDVQPEDAGTYYCVKFRKSPGSVEVFRHGKGTKVSVYSEWGSQGSSRWEPALPGAATGSAHPIPAGWALLGDCGVRKRFWGSVPGKSPMVGGASIARDCWADCGHIPGSGHAISLT